MSIRSRAIKQVLSDCKTLPAYRAKLREMLGIRAKPGDPRSCYVDASKQEVGVEEFSIRDLTEGFLGQDYVSEMHGGPLSDARQYSMAEALQHGRSAQEKERVVYEEAYSRGDDVHQRLVMEDVAPVGPSAFDQINAWNATVGGLIERRMLEAYNAPNFIWRDFCSQEPTRVNGGKIIGIPYTGNYGQYVDVGKEYPTVGLNQLFVWAKPNRKFGMKLALGRETVIYDLTGDLMASAESVGGSLAYGQEYVVAGNVLGLNNIQDTTSAGQNPAAQEVGDSFVMGTGDSISAASAPNPTYQSTAVTTNGNCYNFVNKQTAALTDWTSVQKAQQLLNLMRDPVNSLPFKTEITHLLVDPAQWQLALYIKHATQVLSVTGTPAVSYPPLTQGAASTFPPVGTFAAAASPGNELYGFTPYHSNVWHKVLLDAGVAEGAAAGQAQTVWLAGNPKKAFVWRSLWDARVDQSNPASSYLMERDIVNEWIASWNGRFVVREPRYMVYGQA